MRLKNTAFVYNVTVQGSSNCDWGTELGQSNKHTFTLEGFPEFLNAMMYYKIDDVENIKVVLGKGNRTLKPFSDYSDIQLVLASCFDKVYVNDKLLVGQRFISYILKEVNTYTSKGEINKHNGRCTLKFSNSLVYNGETVNQNCIDAISEAFGLTNNGSWAILEMSIKNEDELHLYGFALGDSPRDYDSKEERNADFERYLNDDDIEYRRAAFKAYLFAPGTFKSKGTAPLYWKHISDSQYKSRISFVWEILSSIVGYQTEDLLVIDNIEDANKLKDIVTPDKRNKDYGNQLASAIIKNYIDFLENRKTILKSNASEQKDIPLDPDTPLQQIFYGAPGTGKSHEIKETTKGRSVVRTTFHPDSDYSTFVGCYKPTMVEEEAKVVPVVVNNGISLDQNSGTYKENRISYQFVMQAFLKAYLGAWKKYADRNGESVKPQFLIIEEINRGNCAQIFGDLFQLLDRGNNRFSEYPIEADTDIQQEIRRAFKEHKDYMLSKDIDVEGVLKDYTSNYGTTLSEDIQSGRVLLLPSNLYIWATMNTSDQSLFPIDSAFKRRWEWKYMNIKNEGKGWKVDVDWKSKDENEKEITRKLDWWDFIDKINKIIASMTSSADKQLGYFFCKADTKTHERAELPNSENDLISVDRFVSKVLFYLWNDVFKDYGFEDASLFQYTDSEGKVKDLTFPDFYKENSNEVNPEMVTDFVQKVMNWKKNAEEKK